MVGTLFFKTLSFSIYFYVSIYLAVSSQMQQAESLIFEAAYQIFPCSSVGKESACNAGDLGSIPGLGRSPGEGNGNPLQYSCLENPMDRGAWWATVHGVARVRHDLVTTPPPPPDLQLWHVNS